VGWEQQNGWNKWGCAGLEEEARPGKDRDLRKKEEWLREKKLARENEITGVEIAA
jgi:hypothetical protein